MLATWQRRENELVILSWNASGLPQENLHLALSFVPLEWEAVCFQEFEAGTGYECFDENGGILYWRASPLLGQEVR